MATAPKVHLYSLSELKTTLDDHLPLLLSSSSQSLSQPLPKAKRFTPIHSTTYVRLALGYSAVAIALYIFYLDYVQKIKFTDIKTTTTLAVLAYFSLNGLLTLWMWFVERGEIFKGQRRDGDTTVDVKIRSLPPHRKYDPLYRLIISWSSNNQPEKSAERDVTAPFSKFFSTDSKFIPAAFEAWVKEVLPLATGTIEDMQLSSSPGTLEKEIAVGEAARIPEGSSLEEVGEALRRETVAKTGADDVIVLGSGEEEMTPRKRGRPRKGQQ
ncbi:MAG: hypothetical protein Q9159_004894 [Coniocarpon cinnabarinum]